LGVI